MYLTIIVLALFDVLQTQSHSACTDTYLPMVLKVSIILSLLCWWMVCHSLHSTHVWRDELQATREPIVSIFYKKGRKEKIMRRLKASWTCQGWWSWMETSGKWKGRFNTIEIKWNQHTEVYSEIIILIVDRWGGSAALEVVNVIYLLFTLWLIKPTWSIKTTSTRDYTCTN